MNKPVNLMKWIIILGIFLLVLPFAIRMINDKPLIPGSEGYGHARIASIIAQKGIPAYDPAMPARQYQINAFDLLLAGFTKVLGIKFAAIILPLVLGIFSLLCVYAVIKKWKLQQETGLAVLLVFALSPFFVDAFVQPVPAGLIIALLAAYVLLLSPSQKERSARTNMFLTLIAIIIACILATFNIITGIAVFVLPMLLRTLNKRVPKSMIAAGIAAFIVLIIIAVPRFLQAESVPFGKEMIVVQAISDFGSISGLSLFAWLLAFIGFVKLWQFKKKYYSIMIAVGIILVASFILPSALPIAHFVISFLAGYAIAFLARKDWVFDDIRILTIFVLVCGLLFSTLTHDLAIARGMPNNEIKNAAIIIQEQYPENTIILSHPNNGHWLAYWSGRQVFLDGWPGKTPGVGARWASAQAIWHSQDIVNARSLLYKNNIGALVITEDMLDRLVWELPEQDLLFLLRNNETFKNAHHSSIVDIWTVLRR